MTYERYRNGTPARHGSLPSSREIQSDVSEIRQEMSRTIDQISEKLAPKELLAQLMSSFSGGSGGRMAKNLTSTLERHPIPVAMIAGGLGYLIYEERQERRLADRTYGSEAPGSFEIDERGGDGQRSSRTVERVRSRASETRARAGELAGRARDGARSLAQEGSRAAGRAASFTRDTADRGRDLVHEQPLVLAGLGIALGAALAGSTPISRRERELLGEPAGELLDELGERAEQLRDRTEQSLRAAGHAARDTFAEQPRTTREASDPSAEARAEAEAHDPDRDRQPLDRGL